MDSIRYNLLNLPEQITGTRPPLQRGRHGLGICNAGCMDGRIELQILRPKNPRYNLGLVARYYLKDHLGNVRVTFGAEPDTTTWTATMESERASGIIFVSQPAHTHT